MGRVLLLAIALIAWEVISVQKDAEFWISRPSEISARFIEWFVSGFMFPHLLITLQEMLLGFLFGATAGVVLGFVLGLSRFVGRLLDPFILAFYSLPRIALAPLFVLWFGIGIQMKVILGATIVFFLVFWNTYAGVRDTDQELVNVLRVMGARRHHVISKVVLPGAMSHVYIGLRLAIPYALTGAVVGEIIASNKGIGFVLMSSAGQFDTTGLFAALAVLLIIAAALNSLLTKTETIVLRWKAAGQ